MADTPTDFSKCDFILAFVQKESLRNCQKENTPK